MKVALCGSLLVSLAVCVGCESAAPSGGQATAVPPPAPPEPAAPAAAAPAAGAAAQQPAAPAAEGAPPAEQPAAPAQAAPPAATPAPAPPAAGEQGDLKQAAVGVGVKGKDYGGPGFVTTPVATKFRAEERIAFEVQIPNAMKIYKADHNNKGPKTHEEFMDVIIKENGVPLPELAPGESYLYVPETEELMVKSPKAQ